jgi:L-Ala-D/L-Glu epimerase / N-acetyl-D-glutamate racemase
MQLRYRRFHLQLTHKWTIANQLGPGGGGGMNDFPVVFVELQSEEGWTARGEAAPSSRYGETPESGLKFLGLVDPRRLAFDDVEGSMRYLDSLAAGEFAAKGALNIALLDGAASRARQPAYDYLGLGFTENKHLTSFSIGIDQPDKIELKTREAEPYPILKLKVGVGLDRENLAALRRAAPDKTVRVDANEAWKTKEEALRNIEWLAGDKNVEFIEQPMPADTSAADLAWLKVRSPLPIFADESCRSLRDLSLCADCFHGVNVKLMKTAGVTGAFEMLRAARQAGLKTMIGCMIESSILISAGAHLAELADYLDLDGNLLVSNDSFAGVTASRAMLSFREAKAKTGLRVEPR